LHLIFFSYILIEFNKHKIEDHLYKSQIFSDLTLGKIDIFQAIKLLENKVENKKDEGVVYTPRYIAEYIIKNINYHVNETIYEPSVGHGIFLFTLIEHVLEKFKLTKKQFTKWFNNNVFANEISTDKVNDLLMLLIIYFERKGIEGINYNNITNTDSLKKNYPFKYDVIIGNPPYVRTKNLNKDYLSFLKQNFHSCQKGNVDIFYAFIELSMKISKRSSMIVPNSYLYNKSATELRKITLSKLKSIVDFKSEMIFNPTRIYTCIYQLSEDVDNKVSYSNSINQNPVDYLRNSLNNEHWLFNENNAKLLPDNLDIKGGIATLRDKLYIIENPELIIIDGKEYFVKYFQEKKFFIEKCITVDFFKITKMNKKYVMIKPYNNKNQIMTEKFICDNYPYAYQYFKAIRNTLDERDKGKVQGYEAWYAYGRKQGIFSNNKKFHLLIPKMSTLPVKSYLIETTNDFLFVSGYVISFTRKEDALNIQRIISSNLFSDNIKNIGKEWPGNPPYYEFKISHLKNI